MKKVIVITAGSNSNAMRERIMRTKKRIATLAQTWLVMGVLIAGMMRATAFGQTSQVDNPDWPLRSSEIHWPAGHTPADADLFAHNELLIHASCSIVWQHLVGAQTWPEWYPNSHNVKLLNSTDGRLHQDTQFSWDTFGVHIESQVHEFAPGRLPYFSFAQGTGGLSCRHRRGRERTGSSGVPKEGPSSDA